MIYYAVPLVSLETNLTDKFIKDHVPLLANDTHELGRRNKRPDSVRSPTSCSSVATSARPCHNCQKILVDSIAGQAILMD
jgi:hypothetical protein